MKAKIYVVWIALVTSLSLCAQTSGTCGPNLTWTLQDSVLTISGTGEMEDWCQNLSRVPWYSQRDSIKSVILGNSITSIGGNAFYHCRNLSSINIPNSVGSICFCAFEGCSKLTSINIPGSVYSIKPDAFGVCPNIISITVDPNNTTYDSRNNCNAIIETATNTIIAGCKNTIIPNGVTTLGDRSFDGCTMTSITIPNTVTTIDRCAFFNCAELNSITIPSSVTFIGEFAFSGCCSLDTIYMQPYMPPTIDVNPFGGGGDLESSCYYTARTPIIQLSGCSYDNYYTTNSSNFWSSYREFLREPTVAISVIVSSSDENAGTASIVQLRGQDVRCDSTAVIRATANQGYRFDHWSDGSTTNPYSIRLKGDTSLIAYFVQSCGDHLSWTLVDGVLTINGTGAMDYYNHREAPWYPYRSSIKNVVIGDGVTSISPRAFTYCDSIQSITVNSGNTVLDSRNNCNAIIETSTNTLIIGCKNTIFPNNITSIGYSAFDGCSGLTAITIPNSVTSISAWAFDDCIGLTSVNFSNNLTIIDHGAFWGCTQLSSIVFPNSVSTIGFNAFSHCSNLTSVTLPNKDISFDYEVFELCRNLISVDLGDSLTTIGDRMFMYCTSLSSITIPKTVTAIGEGAFVGCSGLDTIYMLPTTPPTVGQNWIKNFVEPSGKQPIIVAMSDCSYWSYSSQWSRYRDYIFGPQIDISITISSSDEQAGSVKLYQQGGRDVRCDSTAIIRATANEGYRFDHWSDGNTDSFRQIKLVNDTTLTAYFVTVCGEGLVWTLNDSVLRISGSGVMDDWTSSNNAPWYSQRASITQVIIEDGVTSIGNFAFYGCDSLVSVSIGDSVTSIGKSAFSGCTGLASVTIPNNTTNIGANAFKDVLNIVYNDTITGSPWGARSVNGYVDGVFVYEDEAKTKLVTCSIIVTDSLIIPNSVTTIGDLSFSRCNGLTSITVPNSVTSIGERIFDSCLNLNDVTFLSATPATLSGGSLGKYCNIYVPCNSMDDYKSQWNQIYSMIHYPSLSYSIQGNVNNTSAGEVAVPLTICDDTIIQAISKSVYHFDHWEDGDTTNPRAITLTRDTIYTAIFAANPHITYICDATMGRIVGDTTTATGIAQDSITFEAIPTRITRFVQWSDGDTSNPRTIWLNHDTTFVAEFKYSYHGTCGNSLTWVLEDSVLTISGSGAMTEWGQYSAVPWYSYQHLIAGVVIGDGVTNIGSNAFNGCNLLASATIGSGVTSIGNNAFSSCWRLKSITIPESVNSIGNYAFSSCSGLTSITIPNSVTSVGVDAFSSCSGLTTINLPGVTNIGISAFYSCKNLTSVSIGDSIASIFGNAFANCDKLQELHIAAAIPPTVTGELFYNVPWGVLVYVPDTFVTAYQAADYWKDLPIVGEVSGIGGTCGDHAGWALNDSVLFISGRGDMANNTSTASPWPKEGVKKVVIGDGITNISNYAFYSCSNLDSVRFGNSVASIEKYAFAYCTSLTSFTIPAPVAAVRESAFANCTNMASITFGDSVRSFGNYVFSSCSKLDTVYMKPQTPPSLANYSMPGNRNTVFILSGCSYDTYSANTEWIPYQDKLREPIIDINLTLSVNDARGGNVEIVPLREREIRCDSTAVIRAIPNTGCSFDHWSNGSTMIQDTIALVGDSTLTAFFIIPQDTTSTDTTIVPPVVTHQVNFKVSPAESGFVKVGDSLAVNGLYDTGSVLALVAVPDSGFRFNHWSTGDTTTNISVTVDSAMTLTAFFEAIAPDTTSTDTTVTPIHSGTCGEHLTWTLENGVLTIAGYGSMTNYSGGSDAPWYGDTVHTLVIGDSVTSIGKNAFYGCSNLTAVTVPNSVTTIRENAFTHCDSMKTIIIGEGVISLGNYTFSSCDMLDTVYMLPQTPPALGNTSFPNHVVFILSGCSYDTYYTNEGWARYRENLRDPILGITLTVLPNMEEAGIAEIIKLRDREVRCDSTAVIMATANRGYIFDHWSNGNTVNPSTLQLKGDSAVTAMFVMIPHDTITVHDTTLVQVPVYYYDTMVVHDTTIVKDTINMPVPVYVHDTSYITIHDTTITIIHDTAYVTEYVDVHDTTFIPVHDTTTIHVHDTTVVHFHDTTTLVVYDTTYVTEYVNIHDTTTIFIHDTTFVTQYITLHDTTFVTEYVDVHDTTIIHVHDTTIVNIHDTTTLIIRDTTFVPYPVYDTIYVTEFVHDTTLVQVHDTSFIPIEVHDTMYVQVELRDTMFVPYPVHDTTYVTEYVYVRDTTVLPIEVIVHDTMYVTEYITDTIWMTRFDTIYIRDTVYINDSMPTNASQVEYINVKVYASYGQIVVEGANGRLVTLYSASGQLMAKKQDEDDLLYFDVPTSGSYLVKIGNVAVKQIVVKK